MKARVFLPLLLFILGCDTNDAAPDVMLVRVTNQTLNTFDSIEMVFGLFDESRVIFEEIEVGETTSFFEVTNVVVGSRILIRALVERDEYVYTENPDELKKMEPGCYNYLLKDADDGILEVERHLGCEE